MRLRWLLLLAVVLLLAFVFAPARVAVWIAQGQGWPIAAAKTSGIWWDGGAEGFTMRDRNLGAAEWKWRPAGAGWTFSILGPQVDLQARLQRDQNEMSLSDVRLELPASWIPEMAQSPLLGMGGTVSADVAELRFEDGLLVKAEGQLQWQRAAISMGLAAFDLGTVMAEAIPLQSGPGAEILLQTLESETTDLDANGSLRLDGSNWGLELDLSANNDRTREQLSQWLPMDNQGVARLRYSGSLAAALVD